MQYLNTLINPQVSSNEYILWWQSYSLFIKNIILSQKKKKRKNINKTATVYYILRSNSIEVLSFMKAFTWKNSKVWITYYIYNDIYKIITTNSIFSLKSETKLQN